MRDWNNAKRPYNAIKDQFNVFRNEGNAILKSIVKRIIQRFAEIDTINDRFKTRKISISDKS